MVRAEWVKWRSTTRVLCDCRIPIKFKGILSMISVRPSMLYGN